MAFFAVVMALLLEQARPPAAGHLPGQLLRRWVHAAGRAVDAGGAAHGWLAWALAVVTPTLAVAAVHWALLWLGGWPLALLWAVAVLYVTLGLRRFGRRLSDIRAALETGDEALAAQRLARWQHQAGPAATDALPGALSGPLLRRAMAYAVLAAHRQVFGVLCGFCLLSALGLGPAGAVLYRAADLAHTYWRGRAHAPDLPASAALRHAASTAWAAIDWLPARATALGFAIVGRFEDAVELWRQQAERFAPGNDGVLLAAAAGALGLRLGDATADLPGQPPGLAHFDQLLGLVWRNAALCLLWLALGMAV